MKNQYKLAGILNLLCGVLFVISYIFPTVLAGVTLGWGDAIATSLALFLIFVYAGSVWQLFIFVPFFMILTGTEMLSKHKKGGGVKVWIVCNEIVKILTIAGELLIAYRLLTAPTTLLAAWGCGLIGMSLIMLASVGIDCKALFTRTRKN